jgi:hypothetical protein
MLKKRMERFGDMLFSRSIEPLRRHAVYDGVVAGFDTEYDPRENLVSYQLYVPGRKGILVPGARITKDKIVESIYKNIVRLTGTLPKNVLLVAYFSLADVKFFPVRQALEINEFSGGTFDAGWMTLADGKDQAKVVLTDLSRWFNHLSLAEAAKCVGRRKLEYDVTNISSANLKDPKFVEYAIHDAELVYQIYNDFRERFMALGVDIPISKTPAHTAASIFRLKCVTQEYSCDKNRARFAACRSLWGARAEVFERGRFEETYTEMDIRGCYPNSCLAIGEFPIQKSWRRAYTLNSALRARAGFLDVGFRFPESTIYPCIPDYTDKNYQIYPLEGRNWVTSYEVALALELGAEIKLYEAWVYDQGTPILSDFMRFCLEERAKCKPDDHVMRYVWKLLPNSLTGKFSQRTDKESIGDQFKLANKCHITIDELRSLPREEIRVLADLHHMVLRVKTVGTVWMPEWYSLITGYNRALLSRVLAKAGGIYTHTDSVWTRHPELFDPNVWEAKCAGPATVARTRVAVIWDPKKPHLSHQSINDRATAEALLRDFDGKVDIRRKYGKSRVLHFKEAFSRGGIPGHFIGEEEPGYWRTASTHWDKKRCLLEDGRHTRPWKNLKEYYLAVSETPK